MPYQPPTGWVEQVEALERANLFHEDAGCAAVGDPARLVAVERPGRSRRCDRCSGAEERAAGEVA